LIRSEISGIRRLTGARIIALHLLNKDAGLQSDTRPYSRSWEPRPRPGVKLDAIPNAHDHIAMYKRIGMDFLTKVAIKQPIGALRVHCRRSRPLTFI
jgi:hypothetical protein